MYATTTVASATSFAVLPLALALAGETLQLDLDPTAETPSTSLPPPGIGPVQTAGAYQVRSFFGYHQSREGTAGPWRFYVSSFGRTRADGSSTCHVLLWGGGLEEARIDGWHRLCLLGKLYGPAHWDH